jgi:major curlin subunit
MKFIKVAALAAIVVSGSAMAGLINQGGWGHHGHGGYGGPNSTMNIYQSGGGNSAVALQTDARNSTLNISQTGGGNGADVGQGSDDSTIS